MAVLDKIYEAFIIGELSIQPESPLPKNRTEISELERCFNLTAEQSEELEEFLLDIAADYGRKMFKAGFKIAGEMPDELPALSD